MDPDARVDCHACHTPMTRADSLRGSLCSTCREGLTYMPASPKPILTIVHDNQIALDTRCGHERLIDLDEAEALIDNLSTAVTELRARLIAVLEVLAAEPCS